MKEIEKYMYDLKDEILDMSRRIESTITLMVELSYELKYRELALKAKSQLLDDAISYFFEELELNINEEEIQF